MSRRRRRGHAQYRTDVMDPQTGEVLPHALIMRHAQDREYMASKALKHGQLVALDVLEARNSPFWRKSHAACKFLSEQTERFDGMDAHDILKELQVLTEQHCTPHKMKVPQLAFNVFARLAEFIPADRIYEARERAYIDTEVTVLVPDSLAFEKMDEHEFRLFMGKIYDWLSVHVWPDMSPDRVEQMIELSIGSKRA